MTDIARERHTGYVFDFTIPGDETFWAEGVLVHNCAPCKQIDGYQFESLAAAREDYPNGAYIRCLGELRCRGTVVASWQAAAPALPASDAEELYGPLGRYLGPSSWRDVGLAGSAGEDREPQPRDELGRFTRKSG